MTDPALIDLAIDSDNTGDEAYPEFSFWEDYVENHDYGVGKVIVPDVMVPIVVRMMNDDSIGSFSSGYNYNIVFSDYITSGPGAIKIYQFNQTEEIHPNDPIPLTSTMMVFYVQAIDKQNPNVTTYKEIRDNPKQGTHTTVTIISNGAPLSDPRYSDTVRYVVADRDNFYYKMVHHPELRAFAASDAAYSYGKDLPNFGMKSMLVGTDYHHLAGYISMMNRNEDGFYANIYQDFCAGPNQFTVAFRGTEMNSWSDWKTDIQQVMDYDSTQYDRAIRVGMHVRRNGLSNNVIFTGHSLGGGLAAAATFFATPWDGTTPTRKMAYTFNAAHFFKETGLKFIRKNYGGVLQSIYQDCFEVAFRRNCSLIDAYIVNGEFLDALQQLLLEGRRANGRIIILEKPGEATPESIPDVAGIPSFPPSLYQFFERLQNRVQNMLQKLKDQSMANRISCHMRDKVIEHLEYRIRHQ